MVPCFISWCLRPWRRILIIQVHLRYDRPPSFSNWVQVDKKCLCLSEFTCLVHGWEWQKQTCCPICSAGEMYHVLLINSMPAKCQCSCHILGVPPAKDKLGPGGNQEMWMWFMCLLYFGLNKLQLISHMEFNCIPILTYCLRDQVISMDNHVASRMKQDTHEKLSLQLATTFCHVKPWLLEVYKSQ